MPKEELQATLEAQRELGRDFDAELVERFGEQLERWLEERDARAPARLDHSQKTGIVIVSIIAAIPLIAIASGTGLAAVVAVCAALVVVNYLALR